LRKPFGKTVTPTHALVTGASAGLGRELVRQLVLDRGMTVLATARRLDRLEALAEELPSGRVIVLAGDLADPGFRARLWARAEALPGGLDLLVNNAGLGHYAEFDAEDLGTIRQIIEVNLVALIDLSQRATRHMRRRGAGQILQISSVLGFIGMPYSATYVATKHAVNGLVKSLRYELRGTAVKVRAACPGQTESEFSRVALGLEVPEGSGLLPRGESTAKVAHGIVRGLDGRGAFLMPTASARAIVALAHWLPGVLDWVMGRWGVRRFRGEIERARAEAGASPKPSVP
jgi:short-subunit dehydrogenase